MRSSVTSFCALATSFFLIPSAFAFDSPLSPEAVRDAYFLGQHNDQSTLEVFSRYVKTLAPPDAGPYVSEVEMYTPYSLVIERSRRRSGMYSAQQAELDYRHSQDKLYVRVRINFTETYGVELYRSAKGDKQISGRDEPLPDFYRDFRVGLSQQLNADQAENQSGDHQRANDARSSDANQLFGQERWIEPIRIILQPSYVQISNHLSFIPEDLGLFAFGSASADGYFAGGRFHYPTGWLAWLIYDPQDVASDQATIHVITPDGQNVEVPFDLASLR